jgi:hypothetical protein
MRKFGWGGLGTYDADFGRNRVLRLTMRDSSLARVLALTVLSDNHPIQIFSCTAFQRAFCAGENACGAHVYVLV